MKIPKLLMKKLQTLIAVLSLAACGTGIANANLLSNPDLDNLTGLPDTDGSIPVGWSVLAYKTISNPGGDFNDGEVSEPWCNYLQSGGYGIFFKPFSGTTNFGVYDLLSVYLYQDNPTGPGAQCTLSGWANAQVNFCGYLSLFPTPAGAPPAQALLVVEFLDNGGNVLSSNALDLVTAGLPNTGPGVGSVFATSQYTAPAGTVTVRSGVYMINTYGTTGNQSFFADSLDLEVVYPPGFPVITNQPVATTAALGGIAKFTVGVSNAPSATYQWQLEGVNLLNGTQADGSVVSGATSPMLTITGTTTNSVGHYRVAVTGTGTVPASPPCLRLTPSTSIRWWRFMVILAPLMC